MLYEIQKEIFKQFAANKETRKMVKAAHLALRLPEIVNQILSYLIVPYQYDETKKTKFYQHIYPCLFVNILWHDCATRLLWRHLTFEDSKIEINKFYRFSDIISSHHHLATSLHFPLPIYKMDIDIDFNQDPLYQNYKHIVIPPIETNKLLSSHKKLYQNSIRSIALRKVKDKNLNEPLQKIARHTPKLEKLDIYICDHLTDQSVIQFIQYNNYNLTYLSLAGCNKITDQAIIGVSKYCPKLEHLDLRACGLISDQSIISIANNCSSLYHLNVGRVRDREKITMHSINLIAQKTNVGVLGLAGCDMTDECLILLAKTRGHGLERISVNNCYRITNKSIQAYVQYCPNLSVFEMKECHRIDDWSSVAELVQRKVLLTLCDQQNRACAEWAKQRGRIMEVKAPIK